MSPMQLWFVQTTGMAAVLCAAWIGTILGLHEAGARTARLIIIPKAFGVGLLFAGIFYIGTVWLVRFDEPQRTSQTTVETAE